MKLSITFMPDAKTIRVPRGANVLNSARQAKVTIRTRCGGRASCLMCKVKVKDTTGLMPPNAKEINKLGHLLKEGFRLSCQAKIAKDVTVEVPEDPLKAVIRAKLKEARKNKEEDQV